MRKDRRILGSSSHLPDIWSHVLLRQLAEPARLANTRTLPGILSSHPHSRGSVGCTATPTMRSRSIKLWRFVYRSCPLKRFHKCCSHRFAAGRIRPVCGLWPVPPRRCSFTLGTRPTGPWLQRLFTLNCERRMLRVPQFSLRMLLNKFSNLRGRFRPGVAPAFRLKETKLKVSQFCLLDIGGLRCLRENRDVVVTRWRFRRVL